MKEERRLVWRVLRHWTEISDGGRFPRRDQMGLSGISKSQVSKLCKEIDERVHAFLDRPLPGEWPYLWLDATYLKQREGGRIVSVAAIIAVAANSDGRGPSAHGLDLWGSSSLSRSSSSRLASSGDRGPPPAFAGAGSCSRRSTTAGR
jgi:hypothetical protein